MIPEIIKAEVDNFEYILGIHKLNELQYLLVIEANEEPDYLGSYSPCFGALLKIVTFPHNPIPSKVIFFNNVPLSRRPNDGWPYRHTGLIRYLL
jgi:hypothetical protein